MMVVRIALATLSIAAAVPQVPRDQPRVDLAGTAEVSGTVVTDEATPQPVRRALVTLSRAGLEDIRTAATDDQGRFVFDRLPAGSYSLSATKGGFLARAYGAPRPGQPGSSIVLAAAERFAASPIALWRGAVIAGRLLDRDGQPVADAQVVAHAVMEWQGQRRRRGTGAERSATTDAHGNYRIHGLAPGDYVVASAPPPMATADAATPEEWAWAARGTGAPPQRPRTFTYAPTLFPGTTTASTAVVVSLARGEERLGADFSLQFVPVTRVTGTVTDENNQPMRDLTVFCGSHERNAINAPSGLPIGRTTADGSFACGSLTPGRYSLAVRAGPTSGDAAAEARWGVIEVQATGDDLNNVTIRLQRGESVSGRIALRSAVKGLAPDLARVRITLTPDPSWNAGTFVARTLNAVVAADGGFRVPGVPPGLYQLGVSVPPSGSGGVDWWPQAATLAGRDVLDSALEVSAGAPVEGLVLTLSDTPARISGVLSTADGRPAAQLYVMAFPTDRALWVQESRRVQVVRSAESGAYAIDALPPGEYFLCALTEVDMALRFEPGYLDLLAPASIRMRLGEGEQLRQDLRVGG